MITKKKLDEYIWAGGDIDGWSRSGRKSEITDSDWHMIDTMFSAITIIRRGFAAESFELEHQRMAQDNFDCQETYKALVEYEKETQKA